MGHLAGRATEEFRRGGGGFVEQGAPEGDRRYAGLRTHDDGRAVLLGDDPERRGGGRERGAPRYHWLSRSSNGEVRIDAARPVHVEHPAGRTAFVRRRGGEAAV